MEAVPTEEEVFSSGSWLFFWQSSSSSKDSQRVPRSEFVKGQYKKDGERTTMKRKILAMFLLTLIFSPLSAEALSFSWMRKAPSAVARFLGFGKSVARNSGDDIARAVTGKTGAGAVKTTTKALARNASSPVVRARIAAMPQARAAIAGEIAVIGGNRAVRLFQHYGDDVALLLKRASNEGLSSGKVSEILDIIAKYGAKGIRFLKENWKVFVGGYAMYQVHEMISAEPGDGSPSGEFKKEIVELAPFVGNAARVAIAILLAAFGVRLFTRIRRLYEDPSAR